MTAPDIAASLQTQFPTLTSRASLDVPAFNIPAAEVLAVLTYLRDECGFDLLADLTAIDWAPGASPRFTVVYHLLATGRAEYVRIAADCLSDDEPAMPTATGIWPGADWHERECFDLMGVKFTGHPDLRRILMWDGYPYHPLRKDFPLAGLPTELPDAEIAAVSGTRVLPAPMAGGPFVAQPDGSVTTSAGRGPRSLDQEWSEKKTKPAG
ncbi:MAG: NADH-quinone oxidoreductase subunit C [Opitutaceae bacterium]|nr:NADH-quinone oxidoreductase subunit C [Opitutaceae bacterium]